MVRRSGLLFERGLGAPLSPAREFALSQTVFVGSLAGAVGVFVLAQRWARPDRRADRWLVAPAFGLLAGWVTAAFFVGFVTVLVATGVLGGGPGEAVLGALMLVAGGVVACVVILAGRSGPAQGCLAYGAAVLWALAGVFVNQYQASLITASTAVVCAVILVGTVLFFALRGGRPGRSARRMARPGTA